MKDSEEIKKLAYLRLEEADILCKAGKYEGAFYLAGYSIELMLKSKVCEHFGIDNLFDKEGCAIQGISVLRNVAQTHDIRLLLLLSGLETKFQRDKRDNPKLMENYSYFMSSTGNREDWNEQVRYQTKGVESKQNVESFIALLKDEKGLLEWIKNS